MIGETRFDFARQMRFAALSGDYNPIHVDPIAVRRTLPGRLVVHGVHVLLWALEQAADTLADQPPIARIHVRFLRFSYVDDLISAVLTAQSAEELRLTVSANGVVRADIRVTFGPTLSGMPLLQSAKTYPVGIGPLDHRGASFDGKCGQLAFPSQGGTLAVEFPGATAWLGAPRLEALATATRLVGMIYPGLHSLLGGIDVQMVPETGSNELAFQMGELRFGQIDATISGGGITGMLDCRVPNAPVAQPNSETLRSVVEAGRYAGARVLVVGGSRGAGEAAAKLLALGGADVLISYREGTTDAAAVADDIERAGGLCKVMRYDAALSAVDQLAGLDLTHACWFATPVMHRPDTTLLDEQRAAECQLVLVSGFFSFAASLHARRTGVSIFYPSIRWIDAPPSGLAQYLMAKAAAEVMIRSMEQEFAGIRILAPRLPAMATDQTARMALSAANAAETLLPYVDELIASN